MLLEIDDWRTVGDIQYRFGKCFQNLHLRVYLPRTKDRTALLCAPASRPLSEVRTKHDQGVLSIKSWYTKKNVETLLANDYGLLTEVVLLRGNEELGGQNPKLSLADLNNCANERPGRLHSTIEDADEFIEGWP